MSDIFARASTRAIDRLIQLLPNPEANRTLAYQYLSVVLKGEFYQEHRIAQNDDLSLFADMVKHVCVRSRDAVPAHWRILDVPIREVDYLPENQFQIVYHGELTEVVQL